MRNPKESILTKLNNSSIVESVVANYRQQEEHDVRERTKVWLY